jgi:DNA-binding transcriptional LysR family regulator
MAHNFAVRILPMPLSVPELKVALYWHERTQRQPALRWLRETIADVSKAIV